MNACMCWIGEVGSPRLYPRLPRRHVLKTEGYVSDDYVEGGPLCHSQSMNDTSGGSEKDIVRRAYSRSELLSFRRQSDCPSSITRMECCIRAPKVSRPGIGAMRGGRGGGRAPPRKALPPKGTAYEDTRHDRFERRPAGSESRRRVVEPIDMSIIDLPTEGPYRASFVNLSSSVRKEDLENYLKDLKIESLGLHTNAKGYPWAIVTCKDVASLEDCLHLQGKVCAFTFSPFTFSPFTKNIPGICLNLFSLSFWFYLACLCVLVCACVCA
jgi:hypothetical protein